jgi:hypothetical protein
MSKRNDPQSMPLARQHTQQPSTRHHRRDLPQSDIVGRCDCAGIGNRGIVDLGCVVKLSRNGQQILDEYGCHVADCASEEIAAKLVHRANVHDVLVEALSVAVEELEYFIGFAVKQCEFEGDEQAGLSAVKAAHKAIELAKVQP